MRRLSFAIVGLLALAVAARAGDPWKQKSDKEWDESDLRRIMNDSPWAKQVTISSASSPIQPAGPPAGAPAAAGGYSGSSGNMAGGMSAPPPIPGAASSIGGELNFTVRWASSVTLRRAAVRTAVKSGTMTEEQAEQSLAMPLEGHVLVLIGRNLKMFQQLDETALLKSTYLRMKKTKDKIVPAHAEVQLRPDGKTVDMVVFHFDKRAPNGELVIATDEKGVEFVCEPHGVSIKTTFEPPKMVAQQGPDW